MKNFFKAFFGMFRPQRSTQASPVDIARVGVAGCDSAERLAAWIEREYAEERSLGLYQQRLGRARRCRIETTSSRMCELGTKACVVEHKGAMKYTQMDDGRWQARREYIPAYGLGKTKAEARWNLEGENTAPAPAGSFSKFMHVPMPEGWTE